MSCSGTLRHAQGGIEPATLWLPDDSSYLLSHCHPHCVTETSLPWQQAHDPRERERGERARKREGDHFDFQQVLNTGTAVSFMMGGDLFMSREPVTVGEELVPHSGFRLNIQLSTEVPCRQRHCTCSDECVMCSSVCWAPKAALCRTAPLRIRSIPRGTRISRTLSLDCCPRQ